MADPGGAARHARQMLKPDGHVMVVEPFANDQSREQSQSGRPRLLRRVDDGVRAGVAGEEGPALGAQAGEQRLGEILVNEGGFSRSRRATETPFNMVLEARP